MSTRKFSVILALTVVILATLACSALSTTPTVSNIRMATDDTGKTTTATYSPSEVFFVFADLSNIKVGSVIEAKWYAVNVTGVDANTEINTSDYTYESGIDYVYFKLSTNDGSDWPAGTFRVELYLDGLKVGEQLFAVQ
ncbi:MAG: hypothetical protein HYR70_12085 [Chloroflexi bacterium]|nr:hypothetical protein [Chloroflexota bacterium]MBI3339369.1 hypothetical protein [Chloroflexota bacterium]